MPRFAYEAHLDQLLKERQWPESTKPISELRLVIDYQSRNGAMRALTLDIVDYPGEWLLDLPLLAQSYEDWSAETIRLSRQPDRAKLADAWHADLASLDPRRVPRRPVAQKAARHLHRISARLPRRALRAQPAAARPFPDAGRACGFAGAHLRAARPAGGIAAVRLAPGDDAAALRILQGPVVRPFYRDHIARLDRQIVLVDVLTALNAGPDAVRDLERALTAILDSFNVGRNSILSALFAPRIDRILFAATKADLLHHTSHDRLERILDRLVTDATERAEYSGARIDAVALASVRATREANVGGAARLAARHRRHAARRRACRRPRLRRQVRDRDLSRRPARRSGGDLRAGETRFRGLNAGPSDEADYRFLRFRPPLWNEPTPASPPCRISVSIARSNS